MGHAQLPAGTTTISPDAALLTAVWTAEALQLAAVRVSANDDAATSRKSSTNIQIPEFRTVTSIVVSSARVSDTNKTAR